ncbi:MAG: hypothetical protein AAFQ51_10340 [Pseudomonadota bacterium]
MRPVPDNTPQSPTRRDKALVRRAAAIESMADRTPLVTVTNGEVDQFDSKATSFHKGIPHNQFGVPDPVAFADFRAALARTGLAEGAYGRFDVALGPENIQGGDKMLSHLGSRTPDFAVKGFFSDTQTPANDGVRTWESPLAGHIFDLEGPDSGDVAMAPAPTVGSSELAAEVAEVYAMALLRDVSFADLADGTTSVTTSGPLGGGATFTVDEMVGQLNALSWFDAGADVAPSYGAALTGLEGRRRAAKFGAGDTTVDVDSLFRGSTPGCMEGPYLSQFMMIGTARRSAGSLPAGEGGPTAGYVTFGSQEIDQRTAPHPEGVDFMTDWPLWLDVQNGMKSGGQEGFGPKRFLTTPRDLATYVHYDALYQAYLSACLILLDGGVPADLGFPSGGAHATRGSFASFGPPHILSLLTEVATRGLKAVRRQKFQHHLRGRPEQLAAMLTLAASGSAAELGSARGPMTNMLESMRNAAPDLFQWIATHNTAQNGNMARFPRVTDIADPGAVDMADEKLPYTGDFGGGFRPADAQNYLLPMAFSEGSPMHAAYGAGHATVAGACTTVLKAFFEMSALTVANADRLDQPLPPSGVTMGEVFWAGRTLSSLSSGGAPLFPEVYVANSTGTELVAAPGDPTTMTVEGELNKLAANISIGRNMAGVHYYTDYYDSLRMGERIAVGMLEEQMTTYVEPVSMRLTSFDNDRIVISTNGLGDATVTVHQKTPNGAWMETGYRDWKAREVAAFQPQTVA